MKIPYKSMVAAGLIAFGNAIRYNSADAQQAQKDSTQAKPAVQQMQQRTVRNIISLEGLDSTYPTSSA